MNENDLTRWLTLKQAALRANLWAQEDRTDYRLAMRSSSRKAHRSSFVEWSAYSADKTATTMFYMGITEKDQYYS